MIFFLFYTLQCVATFLVMESTLSEKITATFFFIYWDIFIYFLILFVTIF